MAIEMIYYDAVYTFDHTVLFTYGGDRLLFLIGYAVLEDNDPQK